MYDFSRQAWTDVPQGGVVELSSDAKFKVTLLGEQRAGGYKLDESVLPNRFIATDGAGREVSGIYKVEEDKLTIRGGESKVHLESLQSFDPGKDERTFPLVELVREKE